MRTVAVRTIAVVSVLAAGLSWSAHAAELPLKRVVLSTSGLAQFTHSGEAAPGAALDLSVRLDQVDDLLKSLTVFDREGAIGAVSLAGKTPVAEMFRDLPFGADALNSPSALVGAEIEIEGQVNARGRVFRVEEEQTQLPNNAGQITRRRLTILTEKGLVQAVLEELSALRFTDAQTRQQIDRALAGLARNRAKDRRTLSIGILGQSARTVGFSYVVAAPVWKTAYRLVLPKEGGKARLQGWGVVENLTGSDWKDIELSLISGNPVALRQQLYTAFYVERPEIPVVTASRVLPRKDDGGDQQPEARSGVLRRVQSEVAQMPMNMNTAERDHRGYDRKRAPIGGAAAFGEIEAAPPAPEEMSAPALATQAEEASTQVLYRFPEKLSLTAGSTMMVPFADREITASRTWLYQPETNARRPLAAVRLQNDSAATLPAGIITAFETSGEGATNFAGDAQLPLTPKGSFKFITFALDSKTAIRREDRGSKQTRLAKIANGEMTVTVKSRWTIDYEITAPADEDRDIVIDEARPDGWKPGEGMKDVEETAARLRYKVTAPKGQTAKAALALERLDTQAVTLASLEPDALLTTVTGLENETPAFREAVAKIGAVIADINRAEAQRAELEEERGKIGEDQERIRNNLGSTGQSSDLGRRYLDMLRKQEDRLAAIAEADKGLLATIAAKRKAAADMAKVLAL